MKIGGKRTLTTHVGSLPRPADFDGLNATKRRPPLTMIPQRGMRMYKQRADAGTEVVSKRDEPTTRARNYCVEGVIPEKAGIVATAKGG